MSETIAALATPPLSGPVAVIRISGAKSEKAVGGIFYPAGGKEFASKRNRELVYGSIKINGILLDKAMAVKMKAPYSYTGEDMCEIHLHGSIPIVNAVLEELYRSGIRPAMAGEFTKRAFLHGKMNLNQAEAVMDIITAETRDAARNAVGQLSGSVGNRFASIYDSIANLLAHYSVVVDYPEEKLPEFESGNALQILNQARDELKDLHNSYDRGRILKEGVRAAILGKPNVGKSSFLNALLGYERAIVTPIPGTTRDTLEETIILGGVMLRVTDSAGIRPSEDPVEAMGIQRAWEAAKDAELIFVVIDGSEPLCDLDRTVLDLIRDDRGMVVVNKCDLERKVDIEALEAAFLHVCEISAVTGHGLDHIDAIVRRMFDTQIVCDGSAITNARQAGAISRTLEAVTAALDALAAGFTPDAVMSELEASLVPLGELTGRHINIEILQRIFENFCVGK